MLTLAAEPLGVMVPGVTVHVARAGAPVHVSVISWLNPAAGVTVSCKLAEFPAVTVTVGDARLNAKSCPVPCNTMD